VWDECRAFVGKKEFYILKMHGTIKKNLNYYFIITVSIMYYVWTLDPKHKSVTHVLSDAYFCGLHCSHCMHVLWTNCVE